MRPNRYLYASVPQIDGRTRELYMRTAREAREAIRRDPTLIETYGPAEYVEVERDGTRRRYVLDGQAVRP